MNYFTALGITVALIGAIFLFAVLAAPVEVIGMYFTPVVQIVSAVLVAAVYIGSFSWLRKKSRVA